MVAIIKYVATKLNDAGLPAANKRKNRPHSCNMATNTAIVLIHERVANHDAFCELARQLHTGETELSDALLQLTSTGPSADLSATMSNLEWLAQSEPTLALLFMVALYRVANQAFAHEICDAIELWIEHSGDDQLVSELKLHEQRGDLIAVKAGEWIAAISSKKISKRPV